MNKVIFLVDISTGEIMYKQHMEQLTEEEQLKIINNNFFAYFANIEEDTNLEEKLDIILKDIEQLFLKERAIAEGIFKKTQQGDYYIKSFKKWNKLLKKYDGMIKELEIKEIF